MEVLETWEKAKHPNSGGPKMKKILVLSTQAIVERRTAKP
jgi:hypothetical protein